MIHTSVDRPYTYFYRPVIGRGWWCAATREEWLGAILSGHSHPKAPESWLKQEELEGRSRKTSAIIWGRNYDEARKFTIWSSATEEDFRIAGYLSG